MSKRSAIRRDYLLAQEVIISPGRAARPKNHKATKPKIDQRVATSCFFCPEKLDYNNVIELLKRITKPPLIVVKLLNPDKPMKLPTKFIPSPT